MPIDPTGIEKPGSSGSGLGARWPTRPGKQAAKPGMPDLPRHVRPPPPARWPATPSAYWRGGPQRR